MSKLSMREFAYTHLVTSLPYPTAKFTGQTIIVTGSNTGLGLEAARHFVRLDAARVILAVRSFERGNAAAASIHTSTQRSGVVDVWELDLESYASVQAFAARVDKELDLLHVVVENAGILSRNFSISEQDERHVTVNVVSTLMLGILLLPKLRDTASKIGRKTVLTFTGSWMHFVTKFPERNSDNVFKDMAQEKGARMDDRYSVSKLMELFLVRELAGQTSKSAKSNQVVISILNPGAVATDIVRDGGAFVRAYSRVAQKMFCRTAEEGSRTLVHAAEGAEDTHGQYLDDCKIRQPSFFVVSEEGVQTQRKLWKELAEKLEKIRPGIMQNI